MRDKGEGPGLDLGSGTIREALGEMREHSVNRGNSQPLTHGKQLHAATCLRTGEGKASWGKHSRCCLRLHSLTFKEKQLVKFGKSAYLWVPQNPVSPKESWSQNHCGEVAEAYLATPTPAVFSWGGKSYGCQEQECCKARAQERHRLGAWVVRTASLPWRSC